MTDTKLVLMLGIVSGIGMLAWAVSGVITDRIHSKDYGIKHGQRTYARCLHRSEEPVCFWVTCATCATVGFAVLTVLTTLLVR